MGGTPRVNSEIRGETLSIKEDMKIFLADEIIRWVNAENGTQGDAAASMGVTSPRLSNLMNRRLEKFSVDSLMDCLHNIGYVVRMRAEKDKLSITMLYL